MTLRKNLLKGTVAFAVATLAVRAVGGNRSATRVGLLTGVAVVVATLLSGGTTEGDVETVKASAE